MTNDALVKVGSGRTTPLSDTKPQAVKVDPRPIRRAQNREYLKNANVRAFLTTIAEAEGGDYDLMYGGVRGKKNDKWRINDFSTHPGPGYGGKISAAGRYQINKANWLENGGKKMGLTDFTPETQDLIAVEGLRQVNAINDVIDGDLETAVSKAGRVWNALPLGKGKTNRVADQPYMPYEKIEQIFKNNGGLIKR